MIRDDAVGDPILLHIIWNVRFSSLNKARYDGIEAGESFYVVFFPSGVLWLGFRIHVSE